MAVEHEQARRRPRSPSGSTRPRPRRATSSSSRSATGSSSAASSSSRGRGEWFPTDLAVDRGAARRGRAGGRGGRRPARSRRPARAFEDGWSTLAPSERAKYLFRIARIIQERSRELAVLETLDGGKPIKETRDVDLPLAAAHFFYYAGWADKLEYAFPNRKPKPLGVAGQIIPWNFPLLMLAWKIAPALAAGNTVVLKPAETTPLTALLFADVCRQAELPPGVVNIVTGDGRAGAALVKHPDVDKIAFTGSTEVGKAIQRELAGTGKKLTLELGGKAANIVFDDAALDQAVEGIVNGIYFNQGHVCCAGSRLLVQESIYEQTIAKLKRRLRDAAPRRSARQEHRHRRDQLADAARQDHRARRVRARTRAPRSTSRACRLPEKGYWFAPTVFTNVAQSYRIAQEEIFGPVLSVLTFRTPEEAVEKANNTPYGLSAGVWTEKGSRILWMARAAARRRRLGEHVQPLRPGVAVRRLQGVGLRPRGRPARARAVPGVRSEPAAGPQDVQALRRRRVPALGVRPDVRGARARTSPAPRARTRATPSRRRAMRSRAGPARPPTTAARCSTGSRR